VFRRIEGRIAMADIEKVIKAVEEAFDLVHSDFIGTDDFNEKEWEQNKADALALLKEQEAVKPFIQISEHTGRKWLTCGACEYTIESEKESWEEINFCPKCGRPVLLEGR